MAQLKTLTINGVTYNVTSVVPMADVVLKTSAWAGSNKTYSQVVELPGVTARSKVDLQPTPEQLEIFHSKTLAFTMVNNAGIVTAYSIGAKPQNDYTIQVSLTEVDGTGEIRGNTVGVPNPQADWAQEDPMRADYIKNKPNDLVPSVEPIVCEATGDVISVTDASNRELGGLTIYGKTTQDGTPTPEAPVEMVTAGNSGAINTTIRGTKNLFGGEALADRIVSFGGQKGEDSMGRFVTIDASQIGGKTIFDDFDPNKWYYIAMYGQNTSGKRTTNIGVDYESGRVRLSNFPEDLTVGYSDTNITDKGYGSFKLVGYHSSGTTKLYYDKCGIFEWWTPGFVFANEFEPYKGQTLTAYTPNGLPGIPTTSGGNYTDENGQQWICDEIDFARGVYVQRIGKCIITSADVGNSIQDDCVQVMKPNDFLYQYGSPMLSNRFSNNREAYCDGISTATLYLKEGEFSNRYWADSTSRFLFFKHSAITSLDAAKAWFDANETTVLYILAEPIETPLSAEELAAYAELHTNYPNTTIYNDAGAGLGVKYVADTKLYIDNKFAELKNAILSAGANV